MPDASDRIDAHIAAAQPFARPILKKLRTLVHRARPKLTESIKWGMPAFESDGLVAIVAGFKKHVSLVLWKGKQIGGEFAKPRKFTSLADLPPDREIIAAIRKAVALNAAGVKGPPRPRQARPAPKAPADLAAALRKNAKAAATFKAFSPTCKREYVEWITSAKQPQTRARRLTQAVQWMAQGKKRNWKYENC
jgi:uncharacterized protein YdeI (YjbR/CyaY-like superfamily)